jgi:hypothetical protein
MYAYIFSRSSHEQSFLHTLFSSLALAIMQSSRVFMGCSRAFQSASGRSLHSLARARQIQTVRTPIQQSSIIQSSLNQRRCYSDRKEEKAKDRNAVGVSVSHIFIQSKLLIPLIFFPS